MSDRPPFVQLERGMMVYPGKGWRRLAFKFPVTLWRLGLARFTPPNYGLLTTYGRKTGEPRRTMLEYIHADDAFYLSSGWGKRAQWYRNILANPLVSLQSVRFGITPGEATPVTDSEEITRFYELAKGSSPVWKDFLASWGIEDNLQDFMEKSDRLTILKVTPLPEGDPRAAEAPPPMKADLTWIWGLVEWGLVGLVLLIILWYFLR